MDFNPSHTSYVTIGKKIATHTSNYLWGSLFCRSRRVVFSTYRSCAHPSACSSLLLLEVHAGSLLRKRQGEEPDRHHSRSSHHGVAVACSRWVRARCCKNYALRLPISSYTCLQKSVLEERKKKLLQDGQPVNLVAESFLFRKMKTVLYIWDAGFVQIGLHFFSLLKTRFSVSYLDLPE